MARLLILILAGIFAAGPAAAEEGTHAVKSPLASPVVGPASESANALPRWAVDRPETRPALLPALYGTYAAMQAFDMYSTKKALGAGAQEANPAMRGGNLAGMLAVKAAAGAGTVYLTERMWKKNKAGAIALMIALNGATAAIAAHNLQLARR